jgi:hypothetical protein
MKKYIGKYFVVTDDCIDAELNVEVAKNDIILVLNTHKEFFKILNLKTLIVSTWTQDWFINFKYGKSAFQPLKL